MHGGAVWLGVDCGATRVRAACFRESGDCLEPIGEVHERRHERAGTCLPLDLATQASQREGPVLSPNELCCGQAVVDSTCAVLRAAWDAARVAPGPAAKRRIGVASFGLKDAGGRGIVVARNGPRIPGFLDAVEAQLARWGLDTGPVAGLFSDGVCAAQAECSSKQGALRGQRTGYVLHAGTGLAEALWIDGQLHALDAFPGMWPKAFQIERQGSNLESLLALSGLGQHAQDSDWLLQRALVLAWLLGQRTRTLWEHTKAQLEVVVLGRKLWHILCPDEVRSAALRSAVQSELSPFGLGAPRLVPSSHMEPGVLGAAALARQGAAFSAHN